VGLASRSLLERAQQAISKTSLIFLLQDHHRNCCSVGADCDCVGCSSSRLFFCDKKSDQSSDNPPSDDPSSGGPYKREAVATDTPQCSQIDKDILNANGSAVDATIAAMFCLGVVSMHSSGIGGGGVMLVYNRSLQEASVIDFRETTLVLAKRDIFKSNEKKARRGILSRFLCSEDFLFQNHGNNITRFRKRRENVRMEECCKYWS